MTPAFAQEALQPSRPAWMFRYASHLGYRSPEEPLFPAGAGGLDVERHVAFAAEIGFSGVQYALAVTRPAEERARFAAAMAAHRLEAGCLIYAPMDIARRSLWSSPERSDQDAALEQLKQAIEVASQIGARCIAILSGARPGEPLQDQQARAATLLARAVELAVPAGVVLGLETLSAHRVPDMLFHRLEDAARIVTQVDNAALRLIFDTSHIHEMDGSVVQRLRETSHLIDRVQFADHPGRVEPGAGDIDFAGVMGELRAMNYAGLIELEHGWSGHGVAGEGAGLNRLSRLERASENAAPDREAK